jgi:uncharacterized protein (DUF433 family)
MKKPISKHIYLETEINELRFVGTRISVDAVLDCVERGNDFETVAKEYHQLITPDAVALAKQALNFYYEHSGRKHRGRPKRIAEAI